MLLCAQTNLLDLSDTPNVNVNRVRHLIISESPLFPSRSSKSVTQTSICQHMLYPQKIRHLFERYAKERWQYRSDSVCEIHSPGENVDSSEQLEHHTSDDSESRQ